MMFSKVLNDDFFIHRNKHIGKFVSTLRAGFSGQIWDCNEWSVTLGDKICACHTLIAVHITLRVLYLCVAGSATVVVLILLLNKGMLCYVMLCYVMLCYVMLCYVMLCYVMLCYVMLCYVMLCYSARSCVQLVQ